MDLADLRAPEQQRITKQLVERIRALSPRRICFPTTHSNSLRREAGANWVGKFSLPFYESAVPIFSEMTGYEMVKTQYGNYFLSVKSDNDYEEIEQWIEDQGTRVFLRDALALSLALAENFVDDQNRSEVGALEYRAKYRHDMKAIEHIVAACVSTVRSLPFYRDADCICAVPPRPGKGFDLPSVIAERIAKELDVPDVTASAAWQGHKSSLKEIDVEGKWDQLEAARLRIDPRPIRGKTVLLIDDLYQSGTTIQFVAMKLQEAGARRIYGLSVVKSRRDTDNQ